MKTIYFDENEKLYSPEYYMEVEAYDIRLAILKINDFLETLGDATASLIYANTNEHEDTENKIELDVIRRIHTRHAIIDLNNSYDLLLQIPWFYFRIWNEYNQNGKLYKAKYNYTKTDGTVGTWVLKNKPDIIRNVDGWVEKAEEICNYTKVVHYFNMSQVQYLVDFVLKLDNFTNTFIYNSKQLSVRKLANQIKHKGSLKVKDLYSPYDFNIKDSNGVVINLRDNNLGVIVNKDFYNLDSPLNTLGTMSLEYTDDMYVNIKYKSGEEFRAKDYIKSDSLHSLDDIYTELIDYKDNITQLFENLFNLIKANLSFNPLLESPRFKDAPSINLDKYFKKD